MTTIVSIITILLILIIIIVVILLLCVLLLLLLFVLLLVTIMVLLLSLTIRNPKLKQRTPHGAHEQFHARVSAARAEGLGRRCLDPVM